MLYLIPRLADDVLVDPAEGPADGPPMYTLTRAESDARITLPAPGAYIAMLADGRATVHLIERRAQRVGLEPPEGFVEQLIGALLQAGLAAPVDVHTLPHEMLPGTRHGCEGCGRSCEGHLIGPIPQSEARTILELMPKLAELEPDLAGQKPIVKLPDAPGLYLKIVDGSCLFLADDKRCRIHRHFGGDAKPSICRTFPLVRVYTEDGLRVGINNACFRTHARGAEPAEGTTVSAVETLPAITAYHAPFDVLPLMVEGPQQAERHRRFIATESTVLDYLGSEDATVTGLMSILLGGAAGDETGGLTLTSAAGAMTHELVGRFLERAELRRGFVGFLAVQEGPLATTYRESLAALEAYADGPAPERDDAVDARSARHLLEEVRRLLWLREVLRFETPHHAIGALLAGWSMARTIAPGNRDDAYDRQGELLVAWYRFITEDDLHQKLFDDPEQAHALLRAVAQPS